jgi:DNA-binding response OmpR family regulator
MSAIPLRQEASGTCILKLYNADYALDPFSDRLTSQGYEVVNVHNYEDALEEAHRSHPALIVVYDDPDTDIDAVRWLEMQHTDRNAWMAMTPLLILADSSRVPELSIEELPDRVIILRRHADTLNQLTRAVKRILRVWQLG